MSINPFLEDPIILIMLEEADIDTLKTLREMDSNWNELNLRELESRAAKGGMNAIKLDSQMLGSFMADTRRNPQLFRSFRFQFLNLKVIGLDFYSNYSPVFVQLEMVSPSFIKRSIDEFIKTSNPKLLYNFLSLIAPTLEDLEIHIKFINVPYLIDMPIYGQLVLPKLSRFAIFRIQNISELIDEWPVLKHFKFIFDKGGPIDPTPSLTNLNIDVGFKACSQLFGTNSHTMNQIALARWSKLTHLKIGNHYENNGQRIVELFLQMIQAGSTFLI